MNFFGKLLMVFSGKIFLDKLVDSLKEQEKLEDLIEGNRKLIEENRKKREKFQKKMKREKEWNKKHPPIPDDQLLPEVLSIRQMWRDRCKRLDNEHE